MWNHTDIPVAYLIKLPCYGDVGARRRAVLNRSFPQRLQVSILAPNERWQQHNIRTLKSEPTTLNIKQRKSVEAAIRETCNVRHWLLQMQYGGPPIPLVKTAMLGEKEWLAVLVLLRAWFNDFMNSVTVWNGDNLQLGKIPLQLKSSTVPILRSYASVYVMVSPAAIHVEAAEDSNGDVWPLRRKSTTEKQRGS